MMTFLFIDEFWLFDSPRFLNSVVQKSVLVVRPGMRYPQASDTAKTKS